MSHTVKKIYNMQYVRVEKKTYKRGKQMSHTVKKIYKASDGKETKPKCR